MTKNTRLNHVYLDTSVPSSWQGAILIKRKFNSGKKEEQISVKCDSGCTEDKLELPEMFSFGSPAQTSDQTGATTSNNAVCIVGIICKISSTEEILQTTGWYPFTYTRDYIYNVFQKQ